MNSSAYLTSYGWTPGTGFKKGSLAKPILVHHKKDTKGLGNKAHDHETWWERVFDGRLQDLDVYSSSKSGSEEEGQAVTVRGARDSPLYKMFVKGEGLLGSIGSGTASGSEMKVETQLVVKIEGQSGQSSVETSVEKTITEVDKVVAVTRSSSNKKGRHSSKRKDKIKEETPAKSKSHDEWVRAILKDMKKKKKNKQIKQ
ncbi:hypothetical protein POJ06DRAFT_242014 [Lipomyces tetrasporus]|uniref:G-patch domain-containing protein n=1 Tax=Lipomyces tetrasporus TaxID=54092 RepID=A0AAD7QXY5_9ASCO|nr:uncharacterized protein POJ06DRAFT_242014 [Lipomyces tetrasporus]KAJ8103484.1 hypothetical protein POJ06DRAFT_242014 [Lipomyces tetrasporus]